jgi:hypothetical protein
MPALPSSPFEVSGSNSSCMSERLDSTQADRQQASHRGGPGSIPSDFI